MPAVGSRILVGLALAPPPSSLCSWLGSTAYGMQAPADLGGVVGVVGLLCFIAMGLALGALAPPDAPPTPSETCCSCRCSCRGGGGPPRQVMSGPMRAVSDGLPLSHVVGVRQSWLGTTDDPHVVVATPRQRVRCVAAALAGRLLPPAD